LNYCFSGVIILTINHLINGGSKLKIKVRDLTLAAILTALSIVIPMFMPLKIVIPPASYTLASHVPIIIAVFVSPFVAIAVALGSGLGFFFAGFPAVIVARAFTHLLWASIAAFILKAKPEIAKKPLPLILFIFGTGILHGLGEMLVLIPFGYWKTYDQFMWTLGFVGLGTLIHHTVDFIISFAVVKALQKGKVID
jgi:niacin transporter